MMMIYSMTAFARSQSEGKQGRFTCEIRSINHRYLDVSVYLPDMLRACEMPLREQIRHTIKRGKIECSIRYQAGENKEVAAFSVNLDLAKAICQACEQVAVFLRQPALANPTDILHFPGVLQTNETDLSTLQAEVSDLVGQTLKELIVARGREGEELKRLFCERLDLMQAELAKVRKQVPQVLQEMRQKLLKRFTDASVELDPARLEQEMVMYAQKVDITEEMDRLDTHIHEFRRVLQQGGMVGRRLDFFLQELNREANTLGSKSTDAVITHAAVELKVLIEQIREQVQNVE